MRSAIYDTVTLKCVKSRVPWCHSNLHSFSIYNIIMVIIQQVFSDAWLGVWVRVCDMSSHVFWVVLGF